MIVAIAKNDTTKAEETTAVDERIPFCFFHGKDKGHWTNECPFAIERKEEFDQQNFQPAKPVNHTSQLPPQSSATATTWAPTPNWSVSYPIFNYNPLPYAPPPQQSIPMLPPPQYSQTWSRSSTPLSCDTTLPPPPKLEPAQIPERAIDAPSGSRVNIINAISGGSNEPVLETKRRRKEYFRTVSHVSEGKCFRTTWSHVPISFTQVDLRLQHYPHNDPLVIRANIGKNSVHFAGNDVGEYWWTMGAPQTSSYGSAL